MKTRIRRFPCRSTRDAASHSAPRRIALLGLLALATPGSTRRIAAETRATGLILRDGWLLHRDDS